MQIAILAIVGIYLFAPLAGVLANIVAGILATLWFWQSERVTCALLALDRQTHTADTDFGRWREDRARRRALSRSLRLALRLTVHFSHFPGASLRGHVIARWLSAMSQSAD